MNIDFYNQRTVSSILGIHFQNNFSLSCKFQFQIAKLLVSKFENKIEKAKLTRPNLKKAMRVCHL